MEEKFMSMLASKDMEGKMSKGGRFALEPIGQELVPMQGDHGMEPNIGDTIGLDVYNKGNN